MVPAREWHLSDIGRARCVMLATKLAPYSADRIVSSSEPKAIETAKIVAERLGKPLEIAEGLHEHERTRTPFRKPDQFEQCVSDFFAHPHELVFGEETADSAFGRFANAVENVIRIYARSNMAIVTHGTVIALFVSRLTNLEPFKVWKRLGLPSFVVLDFPRIPIGSANATVVEVVENVE